MIFPMRSNLESPDTLPKTTLFSKDLDYIFKSNYFKRLFLCLAPCKILHNDDLIVKLGHDR